MNARAWIPRRSRLAILASITAVVVGAGGALASSTNVQQTLLVSDQPGIAVTTDSSLINAWGMSEGPTTPIWVSDNGTGLTTLYNGAGVKQGLVVTIAPPPDSPAGTLAAPTGQVFNIAGSGFAVTKGSNTATSRFIFDTEDGTISGWNPAVDGTNSVIAVNHAPQNAVYKGLAIATVGSSTYLYAADFHNRRIDVFDSNWAPASLGGTFTDPGIPAAYGPFNVQALAGNIFVSYAQLGPGGKDDKQGIGHGYVDEYDTSGHLLRRVATRQILDSPWGMAIAPAGFPHAGNLLVGNFGDGRVSAWDINTGRFRGFLIGRGHGVIRIPGLWALMVGTGGAGTSTGNVYFTAGGNDESHGYFGYFSP